MAHSNALHEFELTVVKIVSLEEIHIMRLYSFLPASPLKL